LLCHGPCKYDAIIEAGTFDPYPSDIMPGPTQDFDKTAGDILVRQEPHAERIVSQAAVG
jgi:hypothetical protein